MITPLTVMPDHNNVDITDGMVRIEGPALSIPAAPRLKYDIVQDEMPYLIAKISGGQGDYIQSSVAVHYGGSSSESFNCQNDDVCTNRKGNGSTIDGGIASGGPYYFTLAPSGAVYTFDQLAYDSGGTGNRQVWYYASSASYPNGEVITYTYDTAGGTPTKFRVTKASSNLGFYLTFSYQSSDSNQVGWRVPAQVGLYSANAPSTPLGQLTYDSGNTITDLANRMYSCIGCGSVVGASPEVSSGSMTLPGESSPIEAVTSYRPIANNYVVPLFVSSVARDGVSWSYSYANVRATTLPASTGYTYDNVVVTGPAGYHQTYGIAVVGNADGGPNMITSIADSLGRTTTYSYDASLRPVQVTLPEGNSVQLAYDQWGNITSKVSHPKVGAGLSNISESAAIDANGCSQHQVLCYRPISYTDGLGRETDYAYDTAGRLIQRTDPADATGVRRVTYLTYDSSSFTAPTLVRTCGLGTTCGTNAEIRTQYTYWANTALPASETRVDNASGVSLTTTYTYDNAGRMLSMDGPLPGTDDTVFTRYDVLGRKIWEIGARGADGLHPATFTTYRDADDKIVRVQRGTVSDPTNPSLTETDQTDTNYDTHRNAVRAAVSSPGNLAYMAMDQSYDDRGQKVCETVRMNQGAYGSLPSDACTASTAGSAGPDRITHNVYDAAGQLLQVQKAYGTSIQQNYASYTYSANGKQLSVTDANGNLATMAYDGFDRLSRWTFPSPTSTGQANGSDYEAYGYDAGGNRTSVRKRDGRTIGYSYDALNRVVAKTFPNGGSRGVYYGYDVRGLQTYARFDSASGADGVLSSYDGFGRLVSSTTAMAGTSRTLGYQYDAAGNRLRVTHPDGAGFTFTYDALDRPVQTATSDGVARNAKQYDGAGRLACNYGCALVYGYDGMGRLQSLATTDVSGGNAGNTTTLAYNPASQIASETRSNDAYAFRGAVNVDRSYAANGLNQYTSAGPATFTYDANGNLTGDGTTSYGYDAENRLVSASNGAGLTYDPLGRLWQTTGTATGTTQYLYDGDALAAEYGGSGTLLRRYASGVGEDMPELWMEGSGFGDPRYLFADHQGSIVALFVPTASATLVNGYDEYGIPNAGNTGRFQYTGQAWLPELGMYYYKARMYSPSLGRFLQTDPVGYADQVNLYAYVANDPVNHGDPSGNCTGSLIDSKGGECAGGGFLQGIGSCNPTCASQTISPKPVANASVPGRAGSTPGNGVDPTTSSKSIGEQISDNQKDIIVVAQVAALRLQSLKDTKRVYTVQPFASRDLIWLELKLIVGGDTQNLPNGGKMLVVTPNSRILYRDSTKGGGKTLEFQGKFINMYGPEKFRFAY